MLQMTKNPEKPRKRVKKGVKNLIFESRGFVRDLADYKKGAQPPGKVKNRVFQYSIV
jgi:hypothetical protein